MKRLPRPWAAMMLLCLVLAGARADPVATAGATLNFPATDIEAASQAMAAIMDRPILVDPRVKGQISLYSAQPVSPGRAFAMYQAALRGLGFAVIESSGLLKVVPEADAKLQTSQVLSGRMAGSGDQVATQVFRIVHENASNLVTVLRPLITPNNTINVNPGNNTLVITDYSANLQRIGTLIAALDTPSATDVEVIRLQHTVAADLAVTVQRLAETGGTAAAGAAAAGSALSISADVHINALLVRAPNPARLAAVRALVARLDQPGTAGVAGSNIHVVYLKHADATRLAQVLRASFSPDLARSSSSGTTPTGGTASATPQTVGAGSGTAAANASGASSAQATAAVSATAQPSTGGYIQADPASNSLIITAVEPLYRQLRAVIDQLDTRRAQLYVESLVVEVDASKALDVGMQWQQIFEISSTTDLTLGTVVRALESTAGTNILSTANLVTLDNEEAKIVVGQNVPFVTGQYTSSSTSNPFQTIERKDVGITLRIRPQIGANGTVRMVIFQESSSVSATAAAGTSNAGPTTNKRSIESTVVVDDGKIIVLGGLIEDSYTASRDKVPLLGDLPVLGTIFRSLSQTRKKTNLLVFLRPVIMHDDADAQARTLDRYDFIRAQQQLVQPQRRDPLAGEDGPLLPAAAGSMP